MTGRAGKVCTKCGEWKVLEDFSLDRSRKDGREVRCKACNSRRVSEIIRVRYASDSEWAHEERARRKKHARAKYASDPVWAEKERQRCLQRAREYPEASNLKNQRYRARTLEVGGNITPQEWESLKVRYNYTCLCCGRREPEIALTLDHVVPVSQGGSNVIENAQPLCKPCNSAKGVKTIDYR